MGDQALAPASSLVFGIIVAIILFGVFALIVLAPATRKLIGDRWRGIEPSSGEGTAAPIAEAQRDGKAQGQDRGRSHERRAFVEKKELPLHRCG